MRITLVGYTTPFSNVTGMGGGISKCIYHLAKELKNMGQDVELYIRDDYKPKEKWIKTVYAPKFSWFVYPFFLKRKIKNIEADIYHADYVTTGVPLISKKKRPVVVSIYDVIPFTYKKVNFMDKIRVLWYKHCFRIIKDADAIIVLSKDAKKQALKYTDLDEKKIHVIYIGVDQNKFYPLKKVYGNKIKIGYLGGVGGRKNVILLVNAFKELVKKYDNIELHIGGTGEQFETFKKMNIKNMYLHGRIPENKINEFYNSLDIFVFPTLSEGFGLPPLEAMACGVPVVVCNVSSMPEVVGDAGILVKPTVKDMSRGIAKLIKDRKLREKLSKKGLKRAKKFTWKKCAEETLKIYDSVRK